MTDLKKAELRQQKHSSLPVVAASSLAGTAVEWYDFFLYGTAAVRFALAGPGRYSLDSLLGTHIEWTPALIWAALAVGLAGGIANLALRREPPMPAV